MANTKKLLKLLENINNPSKMLLAVLPIEGNFLIKPFRNYPYNGEIYQLAVFFKEMEQTDENITFGTEQGTLMDLLNCIPLGVLTIKMEEVTWNQLECIGIFINPKKK